jgi:hypothetical protein
MAPARIAKFCDFQAEYEGSIPFTRSKSDFNDLAQIFVFRYDDRLQYAWLVASVVTIVDVLEQE